MAFGQPAFPVLCRQKCDRVGVFVRSHDLQWLATCLNQSGILSKNASPDEIGAEVQPPLLTRCEAAAGRGRGTAWAQPGHCMGATGIQYHLVGQYEFAYHHWLMAAWWRIGDAEANDFHEPKHQEAVRYCIAGALQQGVVRMADRPDLTLRANKHGE